MRGVVILAEDDTAVLEPSFALGAMFRQEVPDGGEFGIVRLRAGQFLDNSLEVASL